MKPIKIIVALVLLAAAVGVGYAIAKNPEILPWESDQPDTEEHIRLFGNIDIRDASIAFKSSERVERVLVEEGDGVEPGTVIAVLNTDQLNDQFRENEAKIATQREVVRQLQNGSRPEEIDRARANLAGAKASLDRAERDVARIEKTAASGASSAQSLDDARAAVEIERANVDSLLQTLDLIIAGPREEEISQAQARLRELQASLASVQTRLDDSVLRSPSKGVVQSRVLEPGEYATPQRPVVVLALTDRKWVRTYIPEPQLGHIATGMRAKVHSDSYAEDHFEGWIGFISPIAEFTPKSVQTTDLRTQLVYEVRVYVDDPDDRLRLGQPVSVVVDPEAPRRQADTRATNPRPGAGT